MSVTIYESKECNIPDEPNLQKDSAPEELITTQLKQRVYDSTHNLLLIGEMYHFSLSYIWLCNYCSYDQQHVTCLLFSPQTDLILCFYTDKTVQLFWLQDTFTCFTIYILVK